MSRIIIPLIETDIANRWITNVLLINCIILTALIPLVSYADKTKKLLSLYINSHLP